MPNTSGTSYEGGDTDVNAAEWHFGNDAVLSNCSMKRDVVDCKKTKEM